MMLKIGVIGLGNIAQKAYLKKTSLYDLAVNCGIEAVSDFVECFIQYDREKRKERN